jgi:hypothetical protein
VDELPNTITTADQAAVALDAAFVLVADTGKRVALPGLPRGPIGVPWLRHTVAPVMRWDRHASWPNVLATTRQASGLDATGYVGARAPGSDEPIYAHTGSEVTDWQLVPRTPLRAGRGLVVYADPFSQPPLAATARSTQHVTTLALLARAYADQLDEARQRAGAQVRQSRAEASQLRLFANRCEALLPELTAPWWPLMRAAIESAAAEGISVPAVPGSQYTAVPISPSR